MTTTYPAHTLTDELIETTVAAPESLRPWITELGHIPTVADVSLPFTHVPEGATTIVLRAEAAGHREAMVVGPQTKATYAKAEKPAGCVRLRLEPGATRQLLGVPATELANRVFRLADFPGVAADLADELTRLAPEEVLPFLAEVLPRRISDDPTQRAHRTLLRTAVAAMSAAPTPVHALAADLAVSERQLRNLFTTGVGVSPKHYARIGRVRHILAHAARPAATTGYYDQSKVEIPLNSLAQVAAENGYYDQSHMSADFKALMGVPPTMFFRGNLPPPAPCREISGVTRPA
ncbi:helix-turn-helix domain-containing protein [Nocardia sp. NPDC051463]|uniref:helix-turn-helix domain-containing protein n=1 Tax=Nocardia sp. NPDC051463 TaxID=3154845 RepID=UPI003437B194